jgi:hypothetical protein
MQCVNASSLTTPEICHLLVREKCEIQLIIVFTSRILKRFLSLIAVFWCVQNTFAQASIETYKDPDAYAIYSAILPKESLMRHGARTAVIQAETAGYRNRFGEPMCLKPVASESVRLEPVLQAFQRANEKPFLLQRKFDLRVPYELETRASINGLIEIIRDPKRDPLGGWEKFFAKYPDAIGIFHMSAVGFNKERTLALVYVGHICLGLCGGGEYHLLEQLNGKWSEIPWSGEKCMWMS